MEALASTFIYRHRRVRITTERHTEFIDLTEGLEQLISESRIGSGLLNVQSLHTTAGVVVNEGEPLLLTDFETLLQKTAPPTVRYAHDGDQVPSVDPNPGERPNGASHCKALFLPTAVSLNIVDGRLQLGRWQRVLLVELDGPRPRDLSVLLVGEGGR